VQVVRPLRVQAMDASTPEGRARERYRLAAWAAITSLASRGLSMVLLVLGVRLTVGYLGTTRFGVWATFASLTAMLSLLDLGVGNALVNRVAHAAALDDQVALRRIVSGGMGLLAIIGLAVGALLVVPAALLPWDRLLKLADPAMAAEARHSAIAFALLFGVNVVGSGMLRILAGQQRSFEANLISAGATGLACLALVAAAHGQAEVEWLLLATFGMQTLGGFVAGALLIRRRQLDLRVVAVSLGEERPHLLRVGSLFLLLQLGSMLGWGSDSVFLGILRGASEVTAYAVALRLFQFASQPFAMLNAPLWAAYADATARHDGAFVRKALTRSFLVTAAGSALLSALLLAFGGPIIAAWTHGAVVVPTGVLALFAIWTVLDATGNAFGVYLNGCGIVKEQVLVVVAFCAAVVPMKLLLGSLSGTTGLLEASILTYLVVIVGLYGLVLRRRVMAPWREAA